MIILSLSVLAGWTFDIELLKTAGGTISMKTNTALGLLACGISLWARHPKLGYVRVALALCAAALASVTLAQHLTGLDAGIDQLLFTEPAGAVATASPNRMGLNASLGLLAAGVALTLLQRGTARAVAWAQGLAVCCCVLAILALAGYAYGAAQLYAVARLTGIAHHTALSLLVLHVGILAERHDQGGMAVFTADGPEGTILRRLAFPVAAIPIGLGYLVLRGGAAGLYDQPFALALFAISVMVVLGAIVWGTARSIAVSESHRRAAERDRDELLERERHARDEAERANQLKDRFIAVLSHELRTPLNVMLGWLRVLETESAADRHATAAAVVARNGRMLARLVEDLLDMSRVSTGQFTIAPRAIAFNAAIEAAVDALRPTAERKQVTIDTLWDAGVGEVNGDPERLQQIAWNLVSNAIKFSPDQGHVAVRTSRRGATVSLTVEDHGVGFDESFASKLFQPFSQADSSFARQFGGLGLGLSIARHIATLHGGTLQGTSAGRGAGATFTLELPAPLPGDGVPSPPSTPMPARQPADLSTAGSP